MDDAVVGETEEEGDEEEDDEDGTLQDSLRMARSPFTPRRGGGRPDTPARELRRRAIAGGSRGWGGAPMQVRRDGRRPSGGPLPVPASSTAASRCPTPRRTTTYDDVGTPTDSDDAVMGETEEEDKRGRGWYERSLPPLRLEVPAAEGRRGDAGWNGESRP